MISRSVAVGLLAAGCLTAVAGGSYLAVRQNASDATAHQSLTPIPPSGVAETEAEVTPAKPAQAADPAPDVEAKPLPAVEAPPTPRKIEPRRPANPVARRNPEPTRRAAVTPLVAADPAPAVAETAAPDTVPPPPERITEPPAASLPPEPAVIEITVPASAVIGLEVENTVTSEQARLEDRVDARVTRDVYADGRLAIPSGSRMVGGVTLVERGGKLKDRARLGVRFHTLVLADGRRLPLRTDTIYRDGASPGAESSRKIGGAAIGGAVLGAILGGGKGAATGAGIGAAGGTAAVMAGGRNAATLSAGSVITVRLADPLTLDADR